MDLDVELSFAIDFLSVGRVVIKIKEYELTSSPVRGWYNRTAKGHRYVSGGSPRDPPEPAWGMNRANKLPAVRPALAVVPLFTFSAQPICLSVAGG
jgi:hypothetical protein